MRTRLSGGVGGEEQETAPPYADQQDVASRASPAQIARRSGDFPPMKRQIDLAILGVSPVK